MKTLEEIRNEVAFETENCKWNSLFMVDQWNYSDEIAKRYAAEAIKADREQVADFIADNYNDSYGCRTGIINLPIELK